VAKPPFRAVDFRGGKILSLGRLAVEWWREILGGNAVRDADARACEKASSDETLRAIRGNAHQVMLLEREYCHEL
jgi:hypothetical protein